MDNLPAHKVSGMVNVIEAVTAQLLYLPPYSPDLNPIEMSFAQIKAEVRRQNGRTVDDLWNTIECETASITSQQARNYFSHIGCGSNLL